VEAGYVPANTNVSAFEDAQREIAVPIFNRPLGDISIAELLLAMFAVTERFKMETQPELLLLQKTMVVIEGVARELADHANIWELARPLITEWVSRHMGPVGRAEALADELQNQLHGWMKLPEQLDTMMARVESGEMVFASESSRLTVIAGAVLTAAGGAWLALSATQGAGSWQLVSSALVMSLGVVLSLSRN
jgi:ubiquinone biosynthesis protein